VKYAPIKLGVVAAARAGLGVAIIARSLVPDDLIELPASAGLPDVGAIDLVLLTSPRSATAPAEALTAAILASGHPVTSRQDRTGSLKPVTSAGAAVS
jgi:DNA-binding transcriptional LysR family regulator